MKFLKLNVPILNFDQINFVLICHKNITLPSKLFLGNIRQIKWNHAVRIYKNDLVGIASFLHVTDIIE